MRYLHYKGHTETVNGQTMEYMQLEHHILLQRRKELKMTQQQVADAAGVQLRQYQRLESGERNISASSGRIMLSICEALMLDPYLFLGKGNQEDESKYVVLPPISTEGLQYAIPGHAYYILVSAIPRGTVCTDDEIMMCLRKAYGYDSLEIKTERNSVELHGYNQFPYWRVVSQRGYLINSFYSSKESQKDKLTAEGIKIVKCGENESYCVDGFEYCHFDINKFKITVLKTDQQILDEMKKIKDGE